MRGSDATANQVSKARTFYSWIVVLAALQVVASRLTPALPPQGRSQPYVISRQVNLVLVPVTVRDRKGQFVSGLNESNFRVYQDGQLQKISLFRSEDIPVTTGLVVDHSTSMRAKRAEVIAGALAFVRASNPEGKGFVINFSNRPIFGLPADIAFSSNLNQLEVALSSSPASGRTALYDALAAALQHLQESQSDKKVLLLISDGGDNASQYDFAQVLEMAQSANAIIYTVGLFDEDSADQNPKVLRKLAKETGGESYFPSSPAEVVSTCQEIAADIRHQYNLAYSPADDVRSGYHRIHVVVTAPGRGRLSVRSRAGYFFPPPTSHQSAGRKGGG